MRKLVFLILGAGCVACSGEAVLPEQQGEFTMPVEGGGQNELYANYKNATIHFEEEQSGDESFFVQEITHQKEDVIFRMKKIPTPLYLRKENPAMPDSLMQDALHELSGEQVFYFEIEEEMRKDILKKYHESDYEKAVSYLAFDIQQDFRLCTADGDTLVPSFTLYERNFRVAPFERIIVDFNGVDQYEAFELVYTDRIFGKGEVVFSFPDEKFVSINVKDVL